MGEMADDHFIELFWSEGTGIGADCGYGPAAEHPAYGGMEAFIARRAFGSEIPIATHSEKGEVRKPVIAQRSRLSIYALLDAESAGRINPCPCCGSKARVVEYPLGISCSRWSCIPGKLPVYLSDRDAMEAGFPSVINRWNTAKLNAERNALIWPSSGITKEGGAS